MFTVDQSFQLLLLGCTVVVSIISGLVSIVSWFAVRTLKLMDNNQSLIATDLKEMRNEIFPRLRSLELDHLKIATEHEMHHP